MQAEREMAAASGGQAGGGAKTSLCATCCCRLFGLLLSIAAVHSASTPATARIGCTLAPKCCCTLPPPLAQRPAACANHMPRSR